MAKKKRDWKVEVKRSSGIEIRKRKPVRVVFYWWRIKAGNNKVLAHSETYTRKQNCLKTARPVAKRLGCPLVVVISEEK